MIGTVQSAFKYNLLNSYNEFITGSAFISILQMRKFEYTTQGFAESMAHNPVLLSIIIYF